MARKDKRGWTVLWVLVILIALLGAVPHGVVPAEAQTSRPNIVLILADDLDNALGTPESTPKIHTLLREQGAHFDQFFSNSSLCCPSRASLLRGQYVHNHGIFTNGGTNGGFGKAFASGIEGATIATALQAVGYRTALLGKYLNGYPDPAAQTYIPPGWSEWASPTSDNAYGGFNYALNENGTLVSYGTQPKDYMTDVLTRKAVNIITSTAELSGSGTPFFLYVAPYVPHQPAVPAPRHNTLFAGARAPRSPSFNEADVGDKPPNVSSQPLLTDREIEQIDTLYRRRLQSMQAVDDMLAAIVQSLTATGQLSNTYLVFTADNGYHMGEHRLNPGKYLPYEEDVRLPLLVRGPGVAAGQTIRHLASMVDLAPTFAAMAGITLPSVADGRSLVPLLQGRVPDAWRQAVLLEQYPFAGQQPTTSATVGYEPYETSAPQIDPNAFYFGMRTASYKYVEYSGAPSIGARELYDLQADPYELENLAATADPAVLERLSVYLAGLRSCVATACQAADAATPPTLLRQRSVYTPVLISGSP